MGDLLISENAFPKTHQGTLAKFNELFIKEGRLPKAMSLWAAKAVELRQTADYDFSSEIEEDELEKALLNDQEFYHLTKAYISQLVADSSQP